MASRSLIGLSLGCLVLAGPCISAAHAVEELVLLRQENIQPLRQIDGDYFQERVLEHHQQFDALVLISKSDRSLELALLDEDQNVIWRQPARSSRVVISDRAYRMAVLGQVSDEGYGPGRGRTIFKGVDVLDFSGNVIYRLNDTGIIRRVLLSPTGQLLLFWGGLHLYDPDGNLLWEHDPGPADASFVGDGRYLKSFTVSPEPDAFTLQLWESSSGEIIREWDYTRYNEKAILYVDPQGTRLLMSQYVDSSPPEWNLVLFDMDNWEPIASLEHLPGGPFSPAWNSQENGFAFLLRRPRIPAQANPGEVLLGFWDLDDGSLVTHGLGEQKIDFHRDGISYDPQAKQYYVRMSSTIHIFGHQQEKR
jgi:hypothetical protein